MIRKRSFAIALCILGGAMTCPAQTNPNLENGIRPFGSYDGSDIDQVNLQTGGLSLRIPLFSYPERGDQRVSVVLMFGGRAWRNWEYGCAGTADYNPDTCKGKWKMGINAAGQTMQSGQLGMYITIDDGIPARAVEPQFYYYPSGGGGALTATSDQALGDFFQKSAAQEGVIVDNPWESGPAPSPGRGIEWPLHFIWMPDGSKHYMVQKDNTTAITIDGSNIVCMGCTSDYSTDNPTEILMPNGSRLTTDSLTGLPRYEDRNGNYIEQGGLDTMGRSIYSALSNQQATDTSGCDTGQSSAYVLKFPGPNDAPGEATSQVKLCFQQETLKSAFGAQFDDVWYDLEPIQESDPISALMLAKVIVYSQEIGSWSGSPAWTFQYNSGNPGGQNADGSYITNFGDLTKITLPSGGTIQYGWASEGTTCTASMLTPVSRWITERTVDAKDGTGPQTTNYSLDGSGSAIVWDPAGNKVVHTFTTPLPSNAGPSPCGTSLYETTTQSYDSSSKLLKTVQTNYAAVEGPAYLQWMPMGTRKVSETTTLDDGTTSQVQTDYDQNLNLNSSSGYGAGSYPGLSYGALLQKREYDYGNPGTLLRCTSYSYNEFSGQNAAVYLSNDLIGLPYVVSTYSGACGGTLASQTTYKYDEQNAQSSGVTTSLDSSISTASGTPRGNLTSVSKWLGSGVQPLLSTTVYFDTGLPYSATTPGNNLGTSTTFYTYSLNYFGAYLTSTKMPDTNSPNLAHHVVGGTYDFNTGILTSYADQNTQTSNYFVDSLGRIIKAEYPDGGVTQINYDPDFLTVHIRKNMDGSRWTDKDLQYDGLGRLSREAVLNGESIPYDQVDSCYNSVGLLGFQSYPYQGTGLSTGKVCSGAGDAFVYDGLYRRTTVTHADSSQIVTQYSGGAVDVRDEGTGGGTYGEHVSQTDGLGRLVSVCEVSSKTQVGASGSASPTACNQEIAKNGFLTSYTYDVLNDLKSVQQAGLSTRQFNYDPAVRLTSAYNPESGWTYYSYYPDGVVKQRQRPEEDQTTSTVLVDTNYAYDALDRLRTTNYLLDATQNPDPYTPVVALNYDEATTRGTQVTNPIGNLTSATTAWSGQSQALTGQYFTAYDNMEREKNEIQCTPRTCSGSNGFGLAYGYDFVGDLTSVGNAQFGTQTNSYNLGMRLSSMSHTSNPDGAILSAAHYGAFGITSAALGNGLTEVTGYDTRGRLSGRQLDGGSNETIPATNATGYVALGGAEQVKQIQTQAATSGSGTVYISGREKSMIPSDCPPPYTGCYLYDSGDVWIKVNGATAYYYYGKGDTPATIASGLASAVNGNSLVTAVAAGASVTITAKSTGSATNYTLGAGYDYDSGDFSSPSFTTSPSGSTLTGGANAVTNTIYDAGTITVTTNGHADSVSFGQGSTPASLATSLAAAINGDSGSAVTASADTTSVWLTSKQTGAGGNYGYTSAATYDTSDFSSPSFNVSPTSASLTGGTNAITGAAYNLALGFYPNGNVATENDSVNGDWTFIYDDFNRLAASSGPVGAYSYGYDRYGNRQQQNLTAGTGITVMQTYSSGNNQMDGACYDAAGNMLDGAHSCPLMGSPKYVYDAENRLVGTAGAVYVYNYAGERIAKQSGSPGTQSYADTTEYLLGPGSEQLAEFDSSGTLRHANEWASGRLWSTLNNGQLSYHTTDWLGTRRMQTSASGGVTLTCSNLPFSDNQICAGSGPDATEHHFTSKERDIESGNDYFEARYYASSMGRFLSPDPSGLYYADPNNPQSFNLYSYALNNPLKFVDPTGLYCTYFKTDFGNSNDVQSVDNNSSFGECSQTGGQWTEVSSVQVNASDNTDNSLTTTSTSTNTQLPQVQPQTQTPPVVQGQLPSSQTVTCVGIGRGLQGNPAYVNHTPRGGAFAAWGVHPSGGTAAVIPSQFNYSTTSSMAPAISQIGGSIGTNNFTSVSDVIGGQSPISGVPVRDALQQLNPGKLILEIPGGSDVGSNALVNIVVPRSQGCPAGTVEAK